MTWHDDDQFWNDLGQEVMLSQEADSEIVRKCALISKLLPERASIIDMCCGKGKYAVELAKLGFQVAALDRSKLFIEEARLRAMRENVNVDFICDDIRVFRCQKEFDVVLSLSTSFGFFREEGDDLSVAENFRHCLKAGGLLLMDLLGKEVLAKRFIKRDWCERGDSVIVVERHAVDDWTWINERWLMFKGSGVKEYLVGYRSYSAAELRGLLYRAGFISVETFGDLKSSAYDEDATRLVIHAKA